MAVNEFDQGVRRQPKQTYVSQHVDMPFKEMMALTRQRQQDYDVGAAQADAVRNTYDMAVLSPDDALLAEKLAETEGNLDAMLEEAGGDYSRLGSKITTEARRIRSDEQLKAMRGNYNNYTQTIAAEKERLDKQEITQEAFNMTRAQAMEDYEDGVVGGNNMNIRGIAAFQDTAKWADDMMKGFESDKAEKGGYGFSKDGNWIIHTDKGEESVTKKDVKSFISGSIIGNKQMMESIEEEAWASARAEFGSGVDIPDDYVQGKVTDAVDVIVDGMANKYGFKKTSKDATIKANKFATIAAKKTPEKAVTIQGKKFLTVTNVEGTESQDTLDRSVSGIIPDKIKGVVNSGFGLVISEQGTGAAGTLGIDTYGNDYLDSLPPGEATDSLRAQVEIARKEKRDPDAKGELRTDEEILSSIDDPEDRDNMEKALAELNKVEAEASKMFIHDLETGNTDFTTKNFGTEDDPIFGNELDRPRVTQTLVEYYALQANLTRLKDIKVMQENKAAHNTGFAKDMDDQRRVIAAELKTKYGKEIAPGKHHTIKSTTDGIAMQLKSADMIDLAAAARHMEEKADGKAGTSNNISIQQVGEDPGLWSTVTGVVVDSWSDYLGITDDAFSDTMQEDGKKYIITKVNPKTGKSEHILMTQEANEDNVAGRILKDEEKNYQQPLIDSDRRRAYKNVLEDNQTIETVNTGVTNRGIQKYWKDGVEISVDTNEFLINKEAVIFGRGRPSGKATFADTASGQMRETKWATEDGTEFSYDDLIQKVIDAGVETTGNETEEQAAAKMIGIGPAFVLTANTDAGGHPDNFLVYTFSDPKGAITGSYRVPTSQIAGDDYRDPEKDAVFRSTSYAANLQSGGVIRSPYTNKELGFVTANGEIAVYKDRDGNEITANTPGATMASRSSGHQKRHVIITTKSRLASALQPDYLRAIEDGR